MFLILSLKKVDNAALLSSSSFASASEDYQNILKIASTSPRIPHISLQKTKKILLSLKPSVNDLYSITAAHYRYSGDAGIEHLNFLLNLFIDDHNNLTIEEVNTVWACILHKGHNKDRTSDRSYRTISTCPTVSKVFDTYISELYSPDWNSNQA